MTAPIIGVTLHREAALPPDGLPLLAVNRAYVDALHRAGAVALGIPVSAPDAARDRLYALCDGLLMPGGADVDPGQYGDAARDGCNVDADGELDGAELALVRRALDDDKPLLGICRGMQVLNVALGGSLWQDLGEIPHAPHPRSDDYAELLHDLRIEAGSLLHDVIGAESVAVNSLHHQAVRDVASQLQVTARAPDGVVEGVEMDGRRFVVALQSHPETLTGRAVWAQRLFDRLVAAAGA